MCEEAICLFMLLSDAYKWAYIYKSNVGIRMMYFNKSFKALIPIFKVHFRVLGPIKYYFSKSYVPKYKVP